MTAAPALVSVRLITDDITASVAFYEQVAETAAVWSTPAFAEIRTDVGTLAIGATETLAVFGGEIAVPGRNRTAIVEFAVDDVDVAWERLRAAGHDAVQEPTTMPWGNRSLLLRDPDGTLVNLFTPVTPEAREKFGR